MRVTAGLTRLAGLTWLACLAGLVTAGPAAADDTPSPSPTATVGTAGTSFLTATAVDPGQQVRVSASTGDYLYWSFDAAAGETDRLAITITLPPGSSRHGPATWTVDVFDGLRRRQPCTAGSQTATAATGDATLALHCLLRQVRSWADPWSDEPLPGTYYIRLSATGLPEQDQGLPIQTDLSITAEKGDAQPDNARLRPRSHRRPTRGARPRRRRDPRRPRSPPRGPAISGTGSPGRPRGGGGRSAAACSPPSRASAVTTSPATRVAGSPDAASRARRLDARVPCPPPDGGHGIGRHLI
jgi:hypothetical protein